MVLPSPTKVGGGGGNPLSKGAIKTRRWRNKKRKLQEEAHQELVQLKISYKELLNENESLRDEVRRLGGDDAVVPKTATFNLTVTEEEQRPEKKLKLLTDDLKHEEDEEAGLGSVLKAAVKEATEAAAAAATSTTTSSKDEVKEALALAAAESNRPFQKSSFQICLDPTTTKESASDTMTAEPKKKPAVAVVSTAASSTERKQVVDQRKQLFVLANAAAAEQKNMSQAEKVEEEPKKGSTTATETAVPSILSNEMSMIQLGLLANPDLYKNPSQGAGSSAAFASASPQVEDTQPLGPWADVSPTGSAGGTELPKKRTPRSSTNTSRSAREIKTTTAASANNRLIDETFEERALKAMHILNTLQAQKQQQNEHDMLVQQLSQKKQEQQDILLHHLQMLSAQKPSAQQAPVPTAAPAADTITALLLKHHLEQQQEEKEEQQKHYQQILLAQLFANANNGMAKHGHDHCNHLPNSRMIQKNNPLMEMASVAAATTASSASPAQTAATPSNEMLHFLHQLANKR